MNYYEKQEAFERQHAAELVEIENNIEFRPGRAPDPCGSCAFEYLVFTILVDGEEV